MIFDTLAPVGSQIALQASSDMDWQTCYPNYTAHFLQSGTAALAAAMQLAKASAVNDNRREVILPAYGCPDLVSAVVYAGLNPVLVDIEPSQPQLSLSGLSDCMGANTLAVVAVNFMGLAERLRALQGVCRQNGCFLIADNAQWFPEPETELYGDFVITSFGRGKPVSLLGGGMLLLKRGIENKSQGAMYERTKTGSSLINRSAFRGKVLVYNALLSPWCYGLLERLPFLSLGETRYKSLRSITAMPDYLLALLPTNIKKYLSQHLLTQQKLSTLITRYDAITDLPALTKELDLTTDRLLRYPILINDASTRDELLAQLNRYGLGATAMYQKALPNIEGVFEHIQVPHEIPNARDFAARLITLPTHRFVQQRHFDRLAKALTVLVG